MKSTHAAEESVEVTIYLPGSLYEEVERLVPREQRERFYREAIERELMLLEDSE